jgi:beta-phosphoglucomutase
MLKGVVFDMDGVLIDSHPAHQQAWRMFLLELGKEISAENMNFLLDGRKREDILRHFLGELTNEQVQTYSKIKDRHFVALAGEVRLIPGVQDFLDALAQAGIEAAVATSASAFRAREMLDRFHLTDRFAAVVTGSEVTRGKPDPEIFQLAAARLGQNPDCLIAFEDAVSGVKAAITAGMSCMGIGTGERASLLLAAGARTTRENFVGLSPLDLHELLCSSANPVL